VRRGLQAITMSVCMSVCLSVAKCGYVRLGIHEAYTKIIKLINVKIYGSTGTIKVDVDSVNNNMWVSVLIQCQT